MAVIIGTTGNDSLTGAAENDTVSGLAGNDTLNGNGTYICRTTLKSRA